MPARLEWNERGLKLGQIIVAEVTGWAGMPRYKIVGVREWSRRYESGADLMQDCETEVRRLLREAGVVVQ